MKTLLAFLLALACVVGARAGSVDEGGTTAVVEKTSHERAASIVTGTSAISSLDALSSRLAYVWPLLRHVNVSSDTEPVVKGARLSPDRDSEKHAAEKNWPQCTDGAGCRVNGFAQYRHGKAEDVATEVALSPSAFLVGELSGGVVGSGISPSDSSEPLARGPILIEKPASSSGNPSTAFVYVFLPSFCVPYTLSGDHGGDVLHRLYDDQKTSIDLADAYHTGSDSDLLRAKEASAGWDPLRRRTVDRQRDNETTPHHPADGSRPPCFRIGELVLLQGFGSAGNNGVFAVTGATVDAHPSEGAERDLVRNCLTSIPSPDADAGSGSGGSNACGLQGTVTWNRLVAKAASFPGGKVLTAVRLTLADAPASKFLSQEGRLSWTSREKASAAVASLEFPSGGFTPLLRGPKEQPVSGSAKAREGGASYLLIMRPHLSDFAFRSKGEKKAAGALLATNQPDHGLITLAVPSDLLVDVEKSLRVGASVKLHGFQRNKGNNGLFRVAGIEQSLHPVLRTSSKQDAATAATSPIFMTLLYLEEAAPCRPGDVRSLDTEVTTSSSRADLLIFPSAEGGENQRSTLKSALATPLTVVATGNPALFVSPELLASNGDEVARVAAVALRDFRRAGNTGVFTVGSLPVGGLLLLNSSRAANSDAADCEGALSSAASKSPVASAQVDDEHGTAPIQQGSFRVLAVKQALAHPRQVRVPSSSAASSSGVKLSKTARTTVVFQSPELAMAVLAFCRAGNQAEGPCGGFSRVETFVLPSLLPLASAAVTDANGQFFSCDNPHLLHPSALACDIVLQPGAVGDKPLPAVGPASVAIRVVGGGNARKAAATAKTVLLQNAIEFVREENDDEPQKPSAAAKHEAHTDGSAPRLGDAEKMIEESKEARDYSLKHHDHDRFRLECGIEDLCSGHGVCIPGSVSAGRKRHCQCELGWLGHDCSVMFMPCADLTCGGGHGVCDPLRGLCRCKKGWKGDSCHELAFPASLESLLSGLNNGRCACAGSGDDPANRLLGTHGHCEAMAGDVKELLDKLKELQSKAAQAAANNEEMFEDQSTVDEDIIRFEVEALLRKRQRASAALAEETGGNATATASPLLRCVCNEGFTGDDCSVPNPCAPHGDFLSDSGSCRPHLNWFSPKPGSVCATEGVEACRPSIFCVADGSPQDTCHNHASGCSANGHCLCVPPYSGLHCDRMVIETGDLTHRLRKGKGPGKPLNSTWVDMTPSQKERAAFLIYAGSISPGGRVVTRNHLFTVFAAGDDDQLSNAAELADVVLARGDRNHDGLLSFNEWLFAKRSVKVSRRVDLLTSAWFFAFSRLDADKDGVVTLPELVHDSLIATDLNMGPGTGFGSGGLTSKKGISGGAAAFTLPLVTSISMKRGDKKLYFDTGPSSCSPLSTTDDVSSGIMSETALFNAAEASLDKGNASAIAGLYPRSVETTMIKTSPLDLRTYLSPGEVVQPILFSSWVRKVSGRNIVLGDPVPTWIPRDTERFTIYSQIPLPATEVLLPGSGTDDVKARFEMPMMEQAPAPAPVKEEGDEGGEATGSAISPAATPASPNSPFFFAPSLAFPAHEQWARLLTIGDSLIIGGGVVLRDDSQGNGDTSTVEVYEESKDPDVENGKRIQRHCPLGVLPSAGHSVVAIVGTSVTLDPPLAIPSACFFHLFPKAEGANSSTVQPGLDPDNPPSMMVRGLWALRLSSLSRGSARAVTGSVKVDSDDSRVLVADVPLCNELKPGDPVLLLPGGFDGEAMVVDDVACNSLTFTLPFEGINHRSASASSGNETSSNSNSDDAASGAIPGGLQFLKFSSGLPRTEAITGALAGLATAALGSTRMLAAEAVCAGRAQTKEGGIVTVAERPHGIRPFDILAIRGLYYTVKACDPTQQGAALVQLATPFAGPVDGRVRFYRVNTAPLLSTLLGPPMQFVPQSRVAVFSHPRAFWKRLLLPGGQKVLAPNDDGTPASSAALVRLGSAPLFFLRVGGSTLAVASILEGAAGDDGRRPTELTFTMPYASNAATLEGAATFAMTARMRAPLSLTEVEDSYAGDDGSSLRLHQHAPLYICALNPACLKSLDLYYYRHSTPDFPPSASAKAAAMAAQRQQYLMDPDLDEDDFEDAGAYAYHLALRAFTWKRRRDALSPSVLAGIYRTARASAGAKPAVPFFSIPAISSAIVSVKGILRKLDAQHTGENIITANTFRSALQNDPTLLKETSLVMPAPQRPSHLLLKSGEREDPANRNWCAAFPDAVGDYRGPRACVYTGYYGKPSNLVGAGARGGKGAGAGGAGGAAGSGGRRGGAAGGGDGEMDYSERSDSGGGGDDGDDNEGGGGASGPKKSLMKKGLNALAGLAGNALKGAAGSEGPDEFSSATIATAGETSRRSGSYTQGGYSKGGRSSTIIDEETVSSSSSDDSSNANKADKNPPPENLLSANFDYENPDNSCDMENPFGFIFCPTPIPILNILIKMMIPGGIRPVIDLIVAKFMNGQQAPLQILNALIPESDNAISGRIPTAADLPVPAMPPMPDTDALAGASLSLLLTELTRQNKKERNSGDQEQAALAQSAYENAMQAFRDWSLDPELPASTSDGSLSALLETASREEDAVPIDWQSFLESFSEERGGGLGGDDGQLDSLIEATLRDLAKGTADGELLADASNAEISLTAPALLETASAVSAASQSSSSAETDALAASITQLWADAKSGTGTDESLAASAAAFSQSLHAAAKAKGALVPALKEGMPKALTQPIVDGLAKVLGPDLHLILHRDLAATLPYSLGDYLNDTVSVNVENALIKILPVTIGETLITSFRNLLAPPLARTITMATARVVSQAVTQSVSVGVVEALYHRSPAAQVDCKIHCLKEGTNCHECEAGKKWLKEKRAEAERLSRWFGQYYTEYYTELFLKEGPEGVTSK